MMSVDITVNKDARYAFKCGNNAGCYAKQHGVSWEMVNKNLPGNEAVGDIDGMIEKNGDFLFLELKTTTNLPAGQRIALEKLSKKPGIYVCYVFAHVDYDELNKCQLLTVFGIRPVKDGETLPFVSCHNQQLVEWIVRWHNERS